MATVALTRNRISVYSNPEQIAGKLEFVADWPLHKALEMLRLGVVRALSHKAAILVPGKHASADMRAPLRHPHVVKARYADSTAGNTGRTWGYGGVVRRVSFRQVG